MQSFIRSFCCAAVIAGASFVGVQAAAPLYHLSLSFTNRYPELKDFNNAGDVLLMVTEDGENGAVGPERPALLRNGALQNLYPTGEANISHCFVTRISERREDGGVYVVGTAIAPNGFYRAAIWNVAADGSFTFKVAPNIILPEDSAAPGEQLYGYGMAVNTSGAMVGSGSSYLAGLATVWRPPYNTAVRYLLSTGSSFVAMREDGFLLADGVEFDHGNEYNRFQPAVLVEGGVPQPVPLLELKANRFYAATGKDMAGEWVVGTSAFGDTSRAFAWKIGNAASENLPNPAEYPEGQLTDVWSVNASGHVLGYFNGGPGGFQPILWMNEGERHTPVFFGTLLPDDPYFNYSIGEARINDNNEVAIAVRGWDSWKVNVYKPLTDGVVQFAYESGYGSESDGRVDFSVRLIRVPGNGGPVTLRVRTADDTAVAPGDYTALDTTVTWAAGESGEKTISVAVPNDNVFKEDRQFKLRMVSATGAQLGSVREAMGYVLDDYSQIGLRNQMTMADGWGGVAVLRGQNSVTLQFERYGGTDGAVTLSDVQFTDMSAHAGMDYTAPSNINISWARGEAGVKTLTIPLLANEAAGDEKRIFFFGATVNLEGSESTSGVSTPVIIAPATDKSSPNIGTWTLNGTKTALEFEAVAAQGATIQLQRSANVDAGWSTLSEQVATDGTLRFSVPVSMTDRAGFFHVRVKP